MRRPSAALVISLLALFIALGGAGYAAFILPPGSVGTAQLRNGAVTATKVNRGSIQVRVTGTCTTNGGASAISAIASSGATVCAGTRPGEVDTATAQPVPVGVPGAPTPTPIASLSLSGQLPQFIQATPSVQVSGDSGGQEIDVTCTLAAAPMTGYSESRTLTLQATTQDGSASGFIPLTITEPGAPGSVTATLDCSRFPAGSAPSVQVTSTINALQTGGNVTETTTGTTTTTPAG